MDSSTRNKLQSACNITYDIPGLRRLPTYYRKNTPLSQAGFVDNYTLLTGGPGNIDVGVIGLADFGRTENGIPRDDILIAFRGTTIKVLDWINDLKALQADSPFSSGKVHQGFLSSTRNLEDPVMNKLSELLDKNPDANIYLTGHSKGGAIATLMGLAIQNSYENYLSRIKVVTFGAPRIGNNEFCNDYYIENYRYESFLDLIPHLPFSIQEVHLLTEEHNHFKKHNLLQDFHLLPPYGHVGVRRAFRQIREKPHRFLDQHHFFNNHKHLDHVADTDDNDLDTLNSLHSIVSSINIINPKDTIKHIIDVHVFDYDHIPEGL